MAKQESNLNRQKKSIKPNKKVISHTLILLILQ